MNLPDWLDATRRIVVVGGGTISHVRSHFALCAPAYGTTARQIAALIGERKDVHMNVDLVLTRMADPENSTIETTEELASKMDYVVADKRTKIIFFLFRFYPCPERYIELRWYESEYHIIFVF